MLKLKIISPEKTICDEEVESVVVPGVIGPFEILTNHAPIISILKKGTVEYGPIGNRKQILIDGGFVEVKQNEVNICVELQTEAPRKDNHR